MIQYNWTLLTIGKRSIMLGHVTMSKEYAEWLAHRENTVSIQMRSDRLYRAVPLPMTGNVYVPRFVEMSR